MLMTNSALAADDHQSRIKTIVEEYLQRLDQQTRDNFRLKQEIANEKSRYLELSRQFVEVRDQQRNLVSDESFTQDRLESKYRQKWLNEKQQMYQTIVNLSQEIEYLSSKNMAFLSDLQKKDSFYTTYRKTLDELVQLRESHSKLIEMIKNHDIIIDHKLVPQQQLSKSPREAHQFKLSQILSCCVGHSSSEVFEIDNKFNAVAPMRRLPLNTDESTRSL